MTPTLRLLLVEDDDLTREMLAESLATHAGLVVAATAASVSEALTKLQSTPVDLALVDLGLPAQTGGTADPAAVPGGVSLLRDIRVRYPHVQRMAHTSLANENVVFQAIRAGAQGYVLKGCSSAELAAALRELSEGGAPMTPRIARLVLRELTEGDAPDVLSPRERQILRHVDAGLTYKEIAARENVSPHTVHSHIKNIYERLQADGKRDALAKARQRGLLA